MQSAGLLTTGLAAQGQPAAPAKTGIKTTLMLEMLKGSIDEEFELAAHAGFQSVESLTQYAAWSDADVARVRSLCRSLHLGVDTVLAQQDWKKRPVSIVDPAHRETFLADIRSAIVYAKKLEIPNVSVTSGLSAAGKTPEQQYASLTEGLKRAADLIAEAKLTLLVEALNSLVDHPGCFLTSNVEALKLVKELNLPHVRLLFDIYHEQISRGNIIRTTDGGRTIRQGVPRGRQPRTKRPRHGRDQLPQRVRGHSEDRVHRLHRHGVPSAGRPAGELHQGREGSAGRGLTLLRFQRVEQRRAESHGGGHRRRRDSGGRDQSQQNGQRGQRHVTAARENRGRRGQRGAHCAGR